MQNHSSQYDFPTTLVPLKANGIVIPHRLAVIRTDTNQPLGIISDYYQLIPHKEVLEKSREALLQDKLVFEEKIDVTQDGSYCLIQYTFPDVRIEIQKGDIVSLQIIIINSYDASTSLRFLIGALRLVCSNGLMINERLSHYSQRHTPKLNINVMQEKFRDLFKYFNGSVVSTMNKMNKSKLSEKTSGRLFEKYEDKKMFPLWLIDNAQTRYQKDSKTVWDFYNSLTYSITHGSGGMNIETKIRYSKKAWQEAVKLLSQNH